MDSPKVVFSAFESETFGKDVSIHVNKPVGSASISPCGRDIVLASRQGLHIIDLDYPWGTPRDLIYHTPWDVADVQWSPFASRDYWVVSTSNQKALVWNLCMVDKNASVEHVLHGHKRAITDINFSTHHPDILATCAVDSYVHCWDLRRPFKAAMTFCDWFAGATQVKWNRQDAHVLASSHDKYLKIWDDRKGSQPLRTIAAHSTKIYGVDWDRWDAQKVTTCSLDQSIRLWHYGKEIDEPEKVIHTSFPVWRARHTPFGAGILALPQRGDNDLHLYDYMYDIVCGAGTIAESVHQFRGHSNQVKEFLWRPRGTVTSTLDDRDFQLVSWGADQHVLLHEVNEEVFDKVGYRKGMECKQKLTLTRRGARYRTFRNEPRKHEDEDTGEGLSHFLSGPSFNSGISRNFVPVSGGYGSEGFMSPVTKKGFSDDEGNPVSWMQGVKIGKRAIAPSGMPDNVSSLLSPTLQTTSLWDTFESLGEEIVTTLSKFPKVIAEDINVQDRRMTLSLSGPWGIDKSPTQLRCRIEFPAAYPNDATPTVAIDKAFSLRDETIQEILPEVIELSNIYLREKRHSLEAILRYLLGEQSLDESLQWLRRHGIHEESATDVDLGVSSSSDEDDEGLARYVPPPTSGLESSDPMIAVNNSEYNVPLPRTCGALWCGNGRLTCFFPKRQEKESLLDQSFLDDARLQRDGRNLFEGFGRLHKAYHLKHAGPMLEVRNDGDADEDYDLISSDSSSSSDDDRSLSHHFMPMVPWNGFLTGANPDETIEASQKSVGDTAHPSTTTSKGSVIVSIQDLTNLLPVKEDLAQNYVIEGGYEAALHNAAVARKYGNSDQVDAWIYAGWLLHQNLPTGSFPASSTYANIAAAVHSSFPSVELEDSAIDLSFDLDEESFAPLQAEWENQNFGRQWLSQSLYDSLSAIPLPELTSLRLDHFETHGDVQMLAMLTCVLSPPLDLADDNEAVSSEMYAVHELPHEFRGKDQYGPEERDRHSARSSEVKVSLQEKYQDSPKGPGSTTSSSVFSSSDPSISLARDATPPSLKPFQISHGSSPPHMASLSASPDHHWTIHRTASNLSALNGSLSKPLQFRSFTISPPLDTSLKKRPSPTGSYLSPHLRTTWTPSSWVHQATTNVEISKTSIPDLTSDAGVARQAGLPSTRFSCTMKNQNQFHDSGSSDAPLLDPKQESKYHCWRQAYSYILHVWDMPLEAAEVLKFSRHLLPPTKPEPSASAKPLPSSTIEQPIKEPSLELIIHCQHCALPPLSKSNHKCLSCHARLLQTPLCIYCNTYILGLASPCLKCGHVMHLACRIAFIYKSSDVFDDDEDDDSKFEGRECITGCGCICADYEAVELPMPSKTTRPSAAYLRKASSIRNSNSPPASTYSSGGGRRGDDLTYRRNSNIGFGIDNEQETTGSGQVEEEDAYVKLRKSLHGEGKRKGSATSASKGLRASASQIWRGN